MKTSHQKTGFALDRPSPMLDPIKPMLTWEWPGDEAIHHAHVLLVSCECDWCKLAVACIIIRMVV